MTNLQIKLFRLGSSLCGYLLRQALDSKTYYKKTAMVFIIRFLGNVFSGSLFVNFSSTPGFTFLWNFWVQCISPILGVYLAILLVARVRDVFLGRSIYTISLLLLTIQVFMPFTDILVFLLACTLKSAHYSKDKPIKFLDALDFQVEEFFPGKKSSGHE